MSDLDLQAQRRADAAARRSGANTDPWGPAGSVGLAPNNGPTTYMPPPRQASSSGQYVQAPPSVPSAGPGAIPDIGAYLNQDSSYQDQLRQFALALSDMNADVTRRRGSLTTGYDSSVKALNDQKVKDLSNMEADYGARGLLRSGLYAKAQGDYNTEFNTRSQDLATQENDALSQLAQQLNQFTSQQQLQSEAARQAAIQRRAAQYGV
jgi:hypothetical protein